MYRVEISSRDVEKLIKNIFKKFSKYSKNKRVIDDSLGESSWDYKEVYYDYIFDYLVEVIHENKGYSISTGDIESSDYYVLRVLRDNEKLEMYDNGIVIFTNPKVIDTLVMLLNELNIKVPKWVEQLKIERNVNL